MGIVIREKKDRRTHERIPADFSVLSRNTGKVIGQVRDFSPEGLFIVTEDEYKRGTKLLVECELKGSAMPVKAYCEVKRIEANGNGPGGIGVEFINIFDSGRDKLVNYMEGTQTKLNSDDYYLSDFADIPDEDLFKKAEVFWQYKLDMEEKGYIRYRRPLASASAHKVVIDDDFTGGKKEMIMMGSNNYLGITSHPSVIKVAKEMTQKYGVGAGSVPLLAGTFDIHRQLELKLAELKGCEDAIIFPSGYVTNLGTIQALVKKEDVAIIDRLAHASIIDGCLISSGTFRTFKHSDMESMENVLRRAKDNYSGKVVVVDGVYSMDGDIAPLRQITEIAHNYGAKVMVDEAHATGVIGEKGKGTPSHFKMRPGDIDIVVGTLSKSLGGVGGFVASTKEVVNYLRYYTRSFFFSSNFPPSVAASVLAAMEIMETDESLHRKLWENIKYMKENLKLLGFYTGRTESAIIPVLIGDELTQKKMSRRMHEEGIYVNAIPHPAVPKGQERFRFSVMATHTREDLDRTLEVTEKLGREFGIIDKPVSMNIPEGRKYNVREISSREEIEKSVKFSWKVYKDFPAWVPYFLIKDHVKLISNDYFYFRKVYGKRFVVEERGEIVGTVSAFIDNYFNRYHNTNVGFLGFFEALPEKEEAIGLLLKEANDFLAGEGCAEIQGPVNGIFGLYGGGFLSSNFGRIPSFLQVYTQPYYHEYFRDSGFRPFKKLLHYTIDLKSPENVESILNHSRGLSLAEVKIRKINKSDWKQEVRGVVKIFNESLAQLWGNVPFDYDEFIEFADEFKSLIDPEFWLVAEAEGEAIGFVGGFPQYSPVFRGLNGELKPQNLLKLPLQLRRIREGAILIVGLLDKYKGRKLGAVLLGRACEAMIEKGYDKVALSYALEENTKSRRILESLGGKVDLYWDMYVKGPE
ncbi:MAG: aminotransferase class I/II-fold pyridoxal phosphate-dependent enzyme [Deltaproteobacteria bacterium]